MMQIRFRTPDGNTCTGECHNRKIRSQNVTYSLEEVEILPPTEPSKIICVGLNYVDHIEETGKEVPTRPSLFIKPPNTIAAHGETIDLLPGIERIDYEAELGVVIGKRCKHVHRKDALDVVLGYTCVNDLSNRDDQRKEQNWVRGKAFDKAAPMGPAIASPEDLAEDARILLRLDGKIMQESSIDKMIFDIPTLIEEITMYMTLEKGDVISTGTPAGVGPIQDGNIVEVEIEGIGVLSNKFKKR